MGTGEGRYSRRTNNVCPIRGEFREAMEGSEKAMLYSGRSVTGTE